MMIGTTLFQTMMLASVAFFVLYVAVRAEGWLLRLGVTLSACLLIASILTLAAPPIDEPSGPPAKFKIIGMRVSTGFVPPFAERPIDFAPHPLPAMVFCEPPPFGPQPLANWALDLWPPPVDFAPQTTSAKRIERFWRSPRTLRRQLARR